MPQHPFAWGRLVVAVALTAGSCTQEAPREPELNGQTLTIYSSLPLQGDSAPQSEDIVRAIELALEDNEGRAGPFRIEHVSLDDATPATENWEPGQVAANARSAAEDPTTIAYLGEFNSGASAISIPITNEAGILQVSPSNTYVGLTRPDGAEPREPDLYYPSGERTYGRVVPADHVQAAAIVSYMKRKGCSSAYLLNDGDTYGKGIADQVEGTARTHGLSILGNDTIDIAAASYEDLGEKIESVSADCFFFGGIAQNRAVDVTEAVAAANPGIDMFFPDGCAERAFTSELSPPLEPRVFLTNPTLDHAAYPPKGQAFSEGFQARFGHEPEPFAIYGYEAMSLVLDAIERAGDAAAATPEGRQAVIDAFFATEDRASVLGTYDIDAFGDTTLTAYGGYTVENGNLAFAEVIQAEVPPTTSSPALDPNLAESPPSPGDTVPSGSDPLIGTWETRPMTEADHVAAAEVAGCPPDTIREHFRDWPAGRLVHTLTFDGERFVEGVVPEEGPSQSGSGGTYELIGEERLELTEPCCGTMVLSVDLTRDELRLRLPGFECDDPSPAYLFAGAPFHRVESPLEGEWEGGKVTLQDIMRERTEREARFVFEENSVEEYMVTTLRLTGERWESFVSADGAPPVPAQSGTFSVSGDRIRLFDPFMSSTYVYRYDLQGSVLTIDLVKSDSPTFEGISDDAFQFAHYEAAPFRRVD